MSIDWQKLAIAETHPLRVKLLELIAGSSEPLSPKQLAEMVEAPVANVSFHVAQLRDKGLVERHHTEPRRGAIANFYVISDAEAQGGSR